MNPPFPDVFMKWLLPLVAASWGIVVIATPPPREGREEEFPSPPRPLLPPPVFLTDPVFGL